MCAVTAAAAGAFVVAAAVALCALPCILAVAEDDRVSNEVQGLDGKHNRVGAKILKLCHFDTGLIVKI